MTDVASRDLRNRTAEILRRVEAGEDITITVNGRPIAELHPVHRRPRFMGREELIRRGLVHQADAALATELRALTGDETTDDLPWP